MSSKQYSATVIVGMKSNYELELNDAIDLMPETYIIDTKKGSFDMAPIDIDLVSNASSLSLRGILMHVDQDVNI